MAIDFPDYLRIAIYAMREQVLESYILKTSDGRPIGVQDAYVIRLLSEVLGFSYDILLPPDMQLGNPTEDGNWTGMVGMLQRGEADLAIGALGLTEERNQVVQFTHPYLFTDVTFVTDKPGYLPKSFAIIYPFSWEMWVALLLFFLFMPFVFYAFLRRRYGFSAVFFSVFGSLLENSMDFRVRALSLRLLLLSWMGGMFFLINSYKAVLLAFLTFPSLSGVRDIRELASAVRNPTFRCHVSPGSYVYNTLAMSLDEGIRGIAECGLRNSRLKGYRTVFELLRNRAFRKCVIAGRSYLHVYQAEFFVSDDVFFQAMVAVAATKGFCCKDTLDSAISRISSAGLFQKFEREKEFAVVVKSRVSSSSPQETDESSDKSLALSDVQGAFGLLMGGLLLAITVFFTEMLHGKWSKRRLRATQVLREELAKSVAKE